MIIFSLFSSFFISFVIADYEHIKEMGFKFWLNPGTVECYHEVLEKGSTLYFMYEILNPHHDDDDDKILVYFRNANNRNIIASSESSHRHYLEYATNETILIDICMDQGTSYTYVKYLSVFFHIYYIDKILTKLKNIEEFDNSSITARNTISSIVHNLIVSREHQIELGLINQKDLYLIEKNSLWIDRWALLHIFIMLSCFLFQTYFIKRLFKISRK